MPTSRRFDKRGHPPKLPVAQGSEWPRAGLARPVLNRPAGISGVKKLEAIIKPFKLAEVKEALAELGIDGLTVCDVKGYQPMNAAPVGSAYFTDLHPKFKIEVVVPTSLIDRAVRSVLAAARTGLAGDGKVFVSSVEEVIRIRTEETGLAAI